MIKINLLAEKKQLKNRAPSTGIETGGNAGQTLLLGAILLACVGLVGGWWYYLGNEVDNWQHKHAEADAELTRLAEVRKKGDAYKKQKALLTKKIDLITELKKKQDVPVHILDQISKNLPSSVWLEQLNADRAVISITGKATNYNAVSNFYNNLSAIGTFSDVNLGRTFEVSEGVAFSIKCNFVLPGQTDGDAAGDNRG